MERLAIEVRSWSGAPAPVRVFRGYRNRADAEKEVARLEEQVRGKSAHVFRIVADVGTVPS